MSILYTLVNQRNVQFTSLTINFFEDACSDDGNAHITFGQTYMASPSQATIDIFWKHHISDIHVLGTLLHEIGHCFVFNYENGGHTEDWLETTNLLMQAANYFLEKIPVLQGQGHNLCAAALGPNYCDNFVESIIVIDG